jgi:hypothetical protein
MKTMSRQESTPPKRWKLRDNIYVVNPAIDEFIAEIEAVCRKYNLSISHEDMHGAFIVEKLAERNIEWLKDAFDGTED